MTLYYEADEQNIPGMVLIPAGLEERVCTEKQYKIEPLIQIKLVGDDYPFGFSQGRTMRNSGSVRKMRFEKQSIECMGNRKRILTVMKDARGYIYRHYVCYEEKSNALEVWGEIENISDHEISIEMISSFTLGAVTPFQNEAEPGTLILHRIRSTWSAEGRLESNPVEVYQLEPSWQKCSANSMRFGQAGSMPVREYVPVIAVEDRKTGVTWEAMLTGGSSWQLEAYRKDEGLSISGGIADRESGHWMKKLKHSEKFVTPPAYITAAEGGIDQTSARLVKKIQDHLILPCTEKEKMPVVFNEFCTSWGKPREEEILRQLELLKGKGIEYFVIDAGWYIEDEYVKTAENWDCVGDWDISKSRFPNGLKAVADRIRAAGMIPGIWFEFETAGRGSRMFEKSRWLLKRDNVDIVSGHRKFLDLKNSQVRQYLNEKVICMLKDNGFQYIKIDYNECIGIGCDGKESPGEELRQQILAVQEFLRELKREIPDIVIEICSSGGHRLTASFLECASMASFSDAHECREIPVIAANVQRFVPARQSQIWAVLRKEHTQKEVYYRMISTMLGRMCISGDIDQLDGKLWETVERGIGFYKKISGLIDRGDSRIAGEPILSYRNPEGWQAVIRENAGGEILLVIHSFRRKEKRICISLPDEAEVIDRFAREEISIRVQGTRVIVENIEDFDAAALYLRRIRK